MAICLDRNSLEYRTLYKIVKGSGISGFLFDSIASHFVEKYGRFPKLEEIPKLDSSKYLIDQLGVTVKDNNIKVKKETLLKYLGLSADADLKTVADKLRKIHTDLVISDVIIFDNLYSFSFHKYPTKWDRVESYPDVKVSDFFNINILNSLIESILSESDKKVFKVTDAELNKPFWKNKIDHARKITKAFIYNGDIYINVDHASIEDPVHELLHLVLGSLAKSDYKVYSTALNTLRDAIPKYIESQKGSDKSSELDILEEIFVKELSKYLTGQKSMLTSLPESIKEELSNMVKKSFDRILYAQSSTNTIPDLKLFSDEYSLKDICEYLNSLYSQSNQDSIKSFIKDSTEYRIESNILNNMIKNKDVIEQC